MNADMLDRLNKMPINEFNSWLHKANVETLLDYQASSSNSGGGIPIHHYYHLESEIRVKEQKAYWSITPAFFVGLVAAIASILAAYASFFPTQAQKLGTEFLQLFVASPHGEMQDAKSLQQQTHSQPQKNKTQ